MERTSLVRKWFAGGSTPAHTAVYLDPQNNPSPQWIFYGNWEERDLELLENTFLLYDLSDESNPWQLFYQCFGDARYMAKRSTWQQGPFRTAETLDGFLELLTADYVRAEARRERRVKHHG